VFLSHDWGADTEKRNHRRVAEIKRRLQARGLTPWFDSDVPIDDLTDALSHGIDSSQCVIVFITQNYIDKVGGRNSEDNCRKEFKYAVKRKTVEKLIPVVMEEQCRNQANWTGRVGVELNDHLYVAMWGDVYDESYMEMPMDELYNRIMEIIKTPVHDVDNVIVNFGNIVIHDNPPHPRNVIQVPNRESALPNDIDLSDRGKGDADVVSLLRNPEFNSVVQSLDFSCNNIGDEGAMALAEALKVNRVMHTLELQNNDIGPVGAIALAEALFVNKTLKHLDLGENEIGPEGAIRLAEALKVNRSLELLGLTKNKIGASGVIKLAKGLQQNNTLEALFLESNKMGDEGAKALIETLKTNRALLKINLGTNQITKKLMDKIKDMLRENYNADDEEED